MGKSYRKTIRFNVEYDENIIRIMEQYKDRNLSQILRKIIRENLSAPLSDEKPIQEKQTKEKIIKWRGF